MKRVSVSALVFGIALVGSGTLQAQQVEGPARAPHARVVSIDRGDGSCRVVLHGFMEASEGSTVEVRLLPRVRHLSSTAAAFDTGSSEVGAVMCRSRVVRGEFEATLRVPLLRAHELEVWIAGSGIAPWGGILECFEPSMARKELPGYVATLMTAVRQAREVLVRLEAYRGSKDPVPRAVGIEAFRLLEEARKYREVGTPLTASAYELSDVLMEMFGRVQFEDLNPMEHDEKNPAESIYAGFGVPKTTDFDPAPWHRRLDAIGALALRETLLELLDPFLEAQAAVSEGGSRMAQTVAAMPALLAQVREGELGACFKASETAMKIEENVKRLVLPAAEAAEPSTVGPRELHLELQALRQKLVSP